MVDKIKEPFRRMTIAGGKEHVFLRMNITYLDNRTAEISIPDYVKQSIAELGENVNKTATSQKKETSTETVKRAKCSRRARAGFSTALLQQRY
jgi:uncharacterized protein YktB (UPF0637 family)